MQGGSGSIEFPFLHYFLQSLVAEKRHLVLRVAFWCVRAFFRALPLPHAVRDETRNFAIRKFGRWLGHVAERVHVEPGNNSRQLRARADEPAIGYVPGHPAPLPSSLAARLVAFYQTDFGPECTLIGDTVVSTSPWQRAAGALPQFEGHIQPRLPGELGFYLPSSQQVLRQQANLAAGYGIEAFCFHIHGPQCENLAASLLRCWIEDDTIELSFCLCWNNPPAPVAPQQGTASPLPPESQAPDADDSAFLASVSAFLQNPKFFRIDGKPVLVVRDPHLLRNPAGTAEFWRHWCLDSGIGPIHLVGGSANTAFDPRTCGFDAAIEIPQIASDTAHDLTSRQHLINPDFRGKVHDWRELACESGNAPLPAFPLYPTILAGYDDEPLQPGQGLVLLHASPRGYRRWLSETVHRRLAGVPSWQRLVFIDAWNDWTHGAILEPDARLGHAWLEATRQALRPEETAPPERPCVVIHAWYADVFAEILRSLKDSGLAWRIVVTTTHERLQAIEEVVGQSGLPVEITCWRNHGRDILPFLHIAERLLAEGEDIVLKLHTKRSPHLQNGEQWRRELIACLLDAKRAGLIFSAFQRTPRLGLVAPEGHIFNLINNMGANERNVSGLLRRAGYLRDIHSDDSFIAGSMFWLRLSAIQPLLDAHLSPSLFETEAGQVDGTLAHAVERCFGLLARHAGFEQTDAASLVGDAPRSAGLILQTQGRS